MDQTVTDNHQNVALFANGRKNPLLLSDNKSFNPFSEWRLADVDLVSGKLSELNDMKIGNSIITAWIQNHQTVTTASGESIDVQKAALSPSSDPGYIFIIDRKLRGLLLDRKTMRQLQELDLSGTRLNFGVEKVEFNPKATQIVTAGHGTIVMWDIGKGKMVASATVADRRALAVRWMDGKPLVVQAQEKDPYDGTVEIWDGSTGSLTPG